MIFSLIFDSVPAPAAGTVTAAYSSHGGGGVASRYGPAARGEWTGLQVYICADCLFEIVG